LPTNDKPATCNDFTKAANGATASSYFVDGRWNIGGWSTYPSADELALSGKSAPATTGPADTRK
jgi:hypothetical protein